MKKICTVSGKEFEITDDDLKFYEKMSVPTPTLCPEERSKRRLSWRNERRLYSRKCDSCNKSIIAMYPGDTPFPVFCPECWFSSKWDTSSFGRDFDFSQEFFPQFLQLQNSAPRLSLICARNENSDYCNLVGESKNCYLIFGSIGCEDCLYGNPEHSKDCVDSLILWNSELCYECVDSENLYQCVFCQNCRNSRDLTLCFDIKNSHDCFLCSGLQNSEYCIMNRQYTREEYFRWKEAYPLTNRQNLAKFFSEFEKLKKSTPRKNLIGTSNINVIGNHCSNSKNCFYTFDVRESEDMRYTTQNEKCNSCMDVDVGEFSELIYEMCGFHRMQDAIFSHWCWDNCQKIIYCSSCRNTKDSFGCVCMDNFSYCILNKQYSKEEYFKLREKIIDHMKETGEWGEFFPIGVSPFAYNETVAQEYFPMTKKEVVEKGWKWREEKEQISKGACSLVNIPNNITDVPNSICEEILSCECCSKNYKIQKAELKFYRKMKLPIPHKCPDCRHTKRMNLRNPRKLWERKCDKCGVDIQTTFAPERPEKVYCEKCYLDSVE